MNVMVSYLVALWDLLLALTGNLLESWGRNAGVGNFGRGRAASRVFNGRRTRA